MQLYRSLQPTLLNYLRAFVESIDAEDIASETWSRITRDLAAFHGAWPEFRAWALTIARHRAIDHLRRRRPTASTSPDDFTHLPARDDPEQAAIETITTATAIATISALPPDQARAVLLRVLIGMDTSTAARILGKRPGAIRTAVYRGLKALARNELPDTSTAIPQPRHNPVPAQDLLDGCGTRVE